MVATNVDKAIEIFQLIIYAILILPAIYCQSRHGRPGLLGWFYVVVYCLIRLIAAGLMLKSDTNHDTSTAAMIVDNIGLSPLLLGAAGILHEA